MIVVAVQLTFNDNIYASPTINNEFIKFIITKICLKDRRAFQ